MTIICRNEAKDLGGLPPTLLKGNYVRVSVTDSGMGMDEVTLTKAMEPFFTTKGIGKGTGLGLSMVHGLTAQCGGATHIASQLGKGTVVTLWLPCAGHEEAPRASEPQLLAVCDAVSRKLRILLVDDDSLVSMNTANMLIDLGHSVLESSSAAKALQVLETDAQFDVVLTDYAMPGMNGLELATKIMQMRPDCPVILASGYAEFPPHTPLSLPRLTKPYSQEELAEILETVVPGTS